jgi:hypothetical protein
MELLDLHAWARRHRDDPDEIGEVARAVEELARERAVNDFALAAARDMAREHVATSAWWAAYHRFRSAGGRLLKKGE